MIRAAAVLFALAGPGVADPVTVSPRPEPRSVRLGEPAALSAQAVVLSPRPQGRPVARAVPNMFAVVSASNRKVGRICGDRRIKGVTLAPVAGALPGCGVADPVQVFSIDKVTLSTPAIMDCSTARALKTWVRDSVKPAIGRRGGGLTQLQVAAHYACRSRNNQKGAKLSEHGKGRAIDVSAFVLKNGDIITVLQGWADRRQGRILKKMHKAACGPFSTVLGPNSDRFHRDHFHLDTARNRRGPYCR